MTKLGNLPKSNDLSEIEEHLIQNAFTEPLKDFEISVQNFTKRKYSALLLRLAVSSLQQSRRAYLIRIVRNRVLIRKGRMGDE